MRNVQRCFFPKILFNLPIFATDQPTLKRQFSPSITKVSNDVGRSRSGPFIVIFESANQKTGDLIFSSNVCCFITINIYTFNYFQMFFHLFHLSIISVQVILILYHLYIHIFIYSIFSM